MIEQIAFVFRNSDGRVAAKTEDGGDIFLPVFQPGITAVINSPALGGETSGDVHFPVMMNTDEQLMVEASSAALGTETSSLTLHMDGETLLSVDSSRIMYSIDGGQFTPGMYTLSVIA